MLFGVPLVVGIEIIIKKHNIGKSNAPVEYILTK